MRADGIPSISLPMIVCAGASCEKAYMRETAGLLIDLGGLTSATNSRPAVPTAGRLLVVDTLASASYPSFLTKHIHNFSLLSLRCHIQATAEAFRPFWASSSLQNATTYSDPVEPERGRQLCYPNCGGPFGSIVKRRCPTFGCACL